MDVTDADQIRETDARALLVALLKRLNALGVRASGPYPGVSRDWDYLELPGSRRVHVQRDGNGYWQALVYEGGEIVRMADPDAGDWPGGPV